MDRLDEQTLCRLEEIPDGDARGFLPDGRREDRLFVVRRGERVHAYLNTCPHNWRPLDWAKDKFLNCRGGDIVCFAHGAHFDVNSGVCTAGVCEGDSLIAVAAQVINGEVRVPAKLPESPDTQQTPLQTD
jgi:nitrite reductase/ring-hydroxylating ferredoxin subunit